MISPLETLGFGFYSHNDNCDILSYNLVSQRLHAYYLINEGDILRSINQMKSRHGTGLPTTCSYQNCGEK